LVENAPEAFPSAMRIATPRVQSTVAVPIEVPAVTSRRSTPVVVASTRTT